MFSLEDLQTIIDERTNCDDGSSYTAQLMNKGTAKCAEKFGEESIEAIIAAIKNDPDELVHEAADVLYHLLVMLKSSDIKLAQVMAVLEQRTGQSGLAEKQARNVQS